MAKQEPTGEKRTGDAGKSTPSIDGASKNKLPAKDSPNHKQPEKASLLQQVASLGESRLHRLLIRGLLILMAIEWMMLLLDQQLLQLFLVTLIIVVLLIPILFRSKMDLEIPAELHIATILFTFAALYLGEIQRFYELIWWWDIALHTTAGLLMGILGFILVYLLNETQQADVQMTPGFIAFFAFLFAVSIGTFWEIFEFAVDELFGTNLQKPMFGDPSGLTDTMWDMIVNAIGAFIISFLGWRYLKAGKQFFVKNWIRTIIKNDPESSS